MNWTPTALLVGIVIIIMTVSAFGGYFGFEMEGGEMVEMPTDLWGFVTNCATFFWGLTTISIVGVPGIFSYIWWFIEFCGLLCIIKIVWPGA